MLRSCVAVLSGLLDVHKSEINSVAIFWHSQGSHPSERTACYGTWGVSTCTQSAAILRPEGLRNGTMNTSGVIIHQEYISVIYVISSGSWIDGNNLS